MGNKQNPESVGGYSMIYLPGFIRSRIMWSIGEAERIKGSPPDTAEVTSVIYMNYTKKIAMGYIAAFLQNMFREDQIYVDPKLKYWSLSPDGEGKEGYKNFS